MTRTLHLHGPGRAGISLARCLQGLGWQVTGVTGGSGRGGAVAATILGVDWTSVLSSVAAEFVLVTVPDACLQSAAVSLLPFAAGKTFLHASGVLGLEVFDSLVAGGARAGTFHPLRSFARPGTAVELGGALVAIDAGDATIRGELEDLARAVGGRPFPLATEGRVLYHLGAATLGNAILAVAAFAEAAFRAAGVPEELIRSGLANLGRGALLNFETMGVAAALTGPLVRGDVEILRRHRAALASHLPEFGDLQTALLETLARVAEVPLASRTFLTESSR